MRTSSNVLRCSECGLEENSREWRRLLGRPMRRRRLMTSFITIFVIMYAPYSWLLFIDYPWSDYHWLWVKIWLGLPGLILFHGFESEPVQVVGAHVFSFAVLAIAVLFGARGWKWLVPIALVLAFLSTWNAIGLYHAFLM